MRYDKAIAIEAAECLKYKNPHPEVTVHDRVTGDTITSRRCRPAACHDPCPPPRWPGRLRRDPGRRDSRAHLPHQGRPRALALDDQVVGTAARPEWRGICHSRRGDGRLPREVGCAGVGITTARK